MWTYKKDVNDYDTPKKELDELQSYKRQIERDREKLTADIDALELEAKIKDGLTKEEQDALMKQAKEIKKDRKALTQTRRSVVGKIGYMKNLMKKSGNKYQRGKKFIKR